MCLDLHGLSETKSLKGESEVLVCEDTDQGFLGAILENLLCGSLSANCAWHLTNYKGVHSQFTKSVEYSLCFN